MAKTSFLFVFTGIFTFFEPKLSTHERRVNIEKRRRPEGELPGWVNDRNLTQRAGMLRPGNYMLIATLPQ
jgi:hypothetical protein